MRAARRQRAVEQKRNDGMARVSCACVRSCSEMSLKFENVFVCSREKVYFCRTRRTSVNMMLMMMSMKYKLNKTSMTSLIILNLFPLLSLYLPLSVYLRSLFLSLIFPFMIFPKPSRDVCKRKTTQYASVVRLNKPLIELFQRQTFDKMIARANGNCTPPPTQPPLTCPSQPLCSPSTSSSSSPFILSFPSVPISSPPRLKKHGVAGAGEAVRRRSRAGR